MVGTFLGRRDKGASTSTTGNKEGLANTWRIKSALPFPPGCVDSVRKLGPMV